MNELNPFFPPVTRGHGNLFVIQYCNVYQLSTSSKYTLETFQIVLKLYLHPPSDYPPCSPIFSIFNFLYFVTPACIRKTYCYIIVCTTISRVCKKLYLIKKKKFCIYSLGKNVFENKFSSMRVSYNSILTCNDEKEKRRIYFTSKYTYIPED